MFSVLRRSRGYGKFKRNRWAMFSLAVIAVYVAVAGWVLLIEGAQAIGERTGAFDLRERPVARRWRSVPPVTVRGAACRVMKLPAAGKAASSCMNWLGAG